MGLYTWFASEPFHVKLRLVRHGGVSPSRRRSDQDVSGRRVKLVYASIARCMLKGAWATVFPGSRLLLRLIISGSATLSSVYYCVSCETVIVVPLDAVRRSWTDVAPVVRNPVLDLRSVYDLFANT